MRKKILQGVLAIFHIATTHGQYELESLHATSSFSFVMPCLVGSLSDCPPRTHVAQSVQALENTINIQFVRVPIVKVRKHLHLQGEVAEVQKARK